MAPTLVAVHSQSKLIRGSKKPTRPKRLHNGVDVLRLDAVDDVVAASGDKVAGSHDLNFGLEQSQHASIGEIHRLSYRIPELFHQCVILLRNVAGVDPLRRVSRRSSVGTG